MCLIKCAFMIVSYLLSWWLNWFLKCHNWKTRTLAHASCILCIDTTATWSGCPTTTWWTRTACTSSPSTWWSAPRTSPGSTSPSMTSRRSPTIFWSEFAKKKKYPRSLFFHSKYWFYTSILWFETAESWLICHGKTFLWLTPKGQI